jgi:DNA-binding transcriptional ArsR family regulator
MSGRRKHGPLSAPPRWARDFVEDRPTAFGTGITARSVPQGMVNRFTTTLDCVDVTFIGDELLEQLPAPAHLGATRVGGIDLNKPRIRAALAAVLALATASGGFTVSDLTDKVHSMTGTTDYTVRQAAYDLRKLRGKRLVTKPGRARRYQLTPQAAGIAALREHVIGPILAGLRSPRRGANPPPGHPWTATTRPFASTCNASSTTSASPPPLRPSHRQHFVDRRSASA